MEGQGKVGVDLEGLGFVDEDGCQVIKAGLVDEDGEVGVGEIPGVGEGSVDGFGNEGGDDEGASEGVGEGTGQEGQDADGIGRGGERGICEA